MVLAVQTRSVDAAPGLSPPPSNGKGEKGNFLRLSRKLFHRILEEYPDLAFMMHGRIVDELQAMVSRIEALAPRFAS